MAAPTRGVQDDQGVSGGGTVEDRLAEHGGQDLALTLSGQRCATGTADVNATLFGQAQRGNVSADRRLRDLPAFGDERVFDLVLGV